MDFYGIARKRVRRVKRKIFSNNIIISSFKKHFLSSLMHVIEALMAHKKDRNIQVPLGEGRQWELKMFTPRCI
jgi:hypothetical protein